MIRTCLDKLGGLSVSEGLHTPRAPRRLPAVLSEQEVELLLSAAPSRRDKALLGLMYACGLRVGEACRLRWADVDIDRKTLRVWRGKGMKDRYVMLPTRMEPLFRLGKERCRAEDFVFVGESAGRHLSPRTAQCVMARAVRLAGIGKQATCQTLRHSFATHLIEHGIDARFIQELLGHVRLETTRIYTHVAAPRVTKLTSPLDRLRFQTSGPRAALPPPRAPTGFLRIRMGSVSSAEGVPASAFTICLETPGASVELSGCFVRELRPGWISLEFPPLEEWEPELAKLSQPERERIESAEFYERLGSHVIQRFLVLRRRQ